MSFLLYRCTENASKEHVMASLAMDIEVWVTMLVIRFLENSKPEENNVWCLVVERARQYVRNNLDTKSDIASREEMAAAAI